MFDRSKRNRVDAAIVVVALLYWLLTGSFGSSRADGVVLADFGTGAVIVTVIGLLGNLFGWKKGKVDSSTLSALNSIRGSVTELGQSFLRGIVDLAGKVAAIAGTFIRFIQKTFSKLYDLLAKVVTRIARILDRIFGPIIDFLDKIRVHLKKFYDKVLKPIIDTIEMVRSFLRVLSFFGIDWSKKLDAQLAELEHYILAPFEFLTKRINEAFEWINRIVTLDGLLQRVTLLQSLLRDASAASNLVLNSSLRERGTGLIPRAPGTPKPVDSAAVIKDLRIHFATGDGVQSPVIRETIANVRLTLQRAPGVGL